MTDRHERAAMPGTRDFEIAGRMIGADRPPFVIAELSGNHNGDLSRALALIDAAKAAGADAVKLQTYTADTITIDHDGPGFSIADGLWKGRSLYELYGEAQTPWDWHEKLFAHARKCGLICFSSPFDETAVDYLQTLDAPAYKIASFELVDIPLIRYAARTGKPLIMSTGMANESEIAEALSAAGGRAMLLHCISGYPTPTHEANLRRIETLGEAFGVPVGLSDHTMGTTAAVAAVACGACVIEKHITLRRADGGPDAAFSQEPDEFAALCRDVRDAFEALRPQAGSRATSEEQNVMFRRSLYVVADMQAGEMFTAANVRSIRPGYGLPPRHYDAVLGKRATRALRRGDPLTAVDVGGLDAGR
jgi:pseudaminic acid synthase